MISDGAQGPSYGSLTDAQRFGADHPTLRPKRMRRFLHFFRHQWSKWEHIVNEQNLIKRSCEVCGLPEYRAVPHLHQWGPWETISKGTLSSASGDHNTLRGMYVIQERPCLSCKLIEIDSDETIIGRT